MDIFELGSYHFYKVIEIIIRAEKGLSRDVVKHLNHVSLVLHAPENFVFIDWLLCYVVFRLVEIYGG